MKLPSKEATTDFLEEMFLEMITLRFWVMVIVFMCAWWLVSVQNFWLTTFGMAAVFVAGWLDGMRDRKKNPYKHTGACPDPDCYFHVSSDNMDVVEYLIDDHMKRVHAIG